MMKPLTLRQATACENATLPRCRCRCGGALHGAKRAATIDAAFFAALPEDDPHYLPVTQKDEVEDDDK